MYLNSDFKFAVSMVTYHSLHAVYIQIFYFNRTAERVQIYSPVESSLFEGLEVAF